MEKEEKEQLYQRLGTVERKVDNIKAERDNSGTLIRQLVDKIEELTKKNAELEAKLARKKEPRGR